MTLEHLNRLLEAIRAARVAVVGDYCLDAYWFADLSRSEISLETGLPTHPVSHQRTAPGGAGNVVANLAALGVGSLNALGVIGDDIWGRELLRLLQNSGADTSGILTQTANWDTLAYVKPHAEGREENRRDFGNFNELSRETAEALVARLDELASEVDVVLINQQVPQGIHTPFLREALAAAIARHPRIIFIADSRHFSGCYRGAWLKLNAHEAVRLTGGPDEAPSRSRVLEAAELLFARGGRPVFVTFGSRGVVVRTGEGVAEIPGVPAPGETDTVGAGDSLLAGVAAALAAGAQPADAASLGNYAAAVTIRKLHQTGTASPDEIRAVAAEGTAR